MNICHLKSLWVIVAAASILTPMAAICAEQYYIDMRIRMV
jgi:hypothetical protein